MQALDEVDSLGQLMTALQQRKSQICAVLPTDIDFDRFVNVINQAVRQEPKLLECHGPSLINACLRAAYDGLMCDGIEAAIASTNERVSKNPDRFRKVARYMPMFHGLRKKLLKNRDIRDIVVTLVHEGDEFKVVGGLNPSIHHIPVMEDSERGGLKAVYSVAIFRDGYRTFDRMSKADIKVVQAAAQYDTVWKKHEGEMWKKTMFRRHYKQLPKPDGFREAETSELFSQYAVGTVDSTLPAPTAPERPVRQLVHEGDAGGVPLGAVFQRKEGHAIARDVDRQSKNVMSDTSRSEAKQGAELTENSFSLPSDEAEFSIWMKDFLFILAETRSPEEIENLRNENRLILNAAPVNMRQEVELAITNHFAEIVSGVAGDEAKPSINGPAEE